MTQFDDREKAFERKYENDQQLQFKVNARRNRLLGMWAAGLIGKTGDEAEAYAEEIVAGRLREARPRRRHREAGARISPLPASRRRRVRSSSRASAWRLSQGRSS